VGDRTTVPLSLSFRKACGKIEAQNARLEGRDQKAGKKNSRPAITGGL
jgi:hypothetical protein